MNFTKVKYGERVTLHWDEQNENDRAEKLTLESEDPPHPDLTRALVMLKRHFLEMLELPSDYGAGLDMRGVTLKHHDGGGIKSVTITAVKHLQNAEVAALNTPHTENISYECMEALCMLCDEAAAYIDGKRATGDLFAESEGQGEKSFKDQVGDFLEEAFPGRVQRNVRITPTEA